MRAFLYRVMAAVGGWTVVYEGETIQGALIARDVARACEHDAYIEVRSTETVNAAWERLRDWEQERGDA